ncbi:MAG: tetratricopeptide repeat protein [Candidatus Obscuribacterales bacterium]|nr:tetratricopeptide repeat protein [Candidatus Obscuribacterales bacterium]
MASIYLSLSMETPCCAAPQADLNALEKRGREYSNGKQWSKAQSVYREILAIRRKSWDASDPRLIGPLNDIIRVTCVDGKCSDTLPFLNELLAIRLKRLGTWHADVATTYALIAEANEKMQRYPEAIRNFNEATKIRDRVYGKTSGISVQSRMNVIRVALKQKDRVTAKSVLQECQTLLSAQNKPQPDLEKVLSYYAGKI